MGRCTVGSGGHFPSQQEDVAGEAVRVCRCLRTRGGREEVELSAEADEAGQRSLDQQVGLKSPNNTDSNAPLA
jgi:hypothetical protein